MRIGMQQKVKLVVNISAEKTHPMSLFSLLAAWSTTINVGKPFHEMTSSFYGEG